MNMILESIILIFTGMIALKMTGSTSVSQMTRVEIIIVVSIGRIIVEPVLSRPIYLCSCNICKHTSYHSFFGIEIKEGGAIPKWQ